MKKIFEKLFRRIGYTRIRRADLFIRQIGVHVVDEYVHSRKYRRSLKGTHLEENIKNVLKEWGITQYSDKADAKTTKPNKSKR